MRKPIVFLILLFVIAVGGTVLWLSFPTAPKVAVVVAVSFQGFTNDSQGVRFATFCITNCTGSSVKRWGHYGVETTLTPWNLGAQARLGPAVILRSGEAEVVSIPGATNGGAWKAVLFFSHHGWRDAVNEGDGMYRYVPERFRRLSIPTEVWQSQWFYK